jgi:hypothetical protein
MTYKPPHTVNPHATNPIGAAEFLGIASPTLEKDRRTGHLGVPYVKAGRRVLYQLSDLSAWLDANKVTPVPQEVQQ